MTRDCILVAIGLDDQAEQLVHTGKRMADALDAQWSVVYVETPELLRLSAAKRDRRIDLLRLAESLGAQTITLDGPTAAQALLEYAQTRNATRVVIGSPKRTGWRASLRPSTTVELVRHAHGFDVIALSPQDQSAHTTGPSATAPQSGNRFTLHPERYAWALLTTLVCTAIAFAMFSSFDLVNLVMVYVLGATFAGARFGRGPALVSAVANVAAFDFCFVPPHFSFSVADVEYLVTFGVMLIVTLLIANLMASVRRQTRVAGARERRTAQLYAMSRELAATRGTGNMARVAVRHVAEVFQCHSVVLLPNESGRLQYPCESRIAGSFLSADLSAAQWAADYGRHAGLGSDTLSTASAIYLPLGDEKHTLGVLGVLPSDRRRVLLPEQRHLLETFASQIGLALERAQLAETAESARVAAETESLRNTLLASISHDLRTPLSVIAGAGSTLAEHGANLDEPTRAALARSIESKAREMSRLISNVLDLMRFESGQVALRRDWQTLDDLVGSALNQLQDRMVEHSVEVRIPQEVPAVYVDANLIVQVFYNLLENISKYTPAGTRVQISANVADDVVEVTVDDDGPGLPEGELNRLFEKFQRGKDESSIAGAGLGLAICDAILEAHGAHIQARQRPGGGARFTFSLAIAAESTKP